MSTQTESHIERARKAHHAALERIAPGSSLTGLQIWRKLRRIEGSVTSRTTAYCNGAISMELCDRECRKALCAVIKVLGGQTKGLFVNRDPRGYALKLDNEKATIPEGMHQDWGRYGILAPEIN